MGGLSRWCTAGMFSSTASLSAMARPGCIRAIVGASLSALRCEGWRWMPGASKKGCGGKHHRCRPGNGNACIRTTVSGAGDDTSARCRGYGPLDEATCHRQKFFYRLLFTMSIFILSFGFAITEKNRHPTSCKNLIVANTPWPNLPWQAAMVLFSSTRRLILILQSKQKTSLWLSPYRQAKKRRGSFSKHADITDSITQPSLLTMRSGLLPFQ